MKNIRRWLECRCSRGDLGAYVDGELSPEMRARFDAHIAECPGCQELVRGLHALARTVEMLPAEDEPPAGFVDRVMQRIPPAVVTPIPVARPRRLMPVAVPAAALVVVAAGLALILLRQPSVGPAIPSPRVAQIPAPAPVPPVVAELPKNPAPPQQPVATPKPTVRAPVAIRHVSPGRRRPPTPPPSRIREQVAPPVEVAQAPPVQVAEAPTVAEAAAAQQHLDAGRVYEDQGDLGQALQEYGDARYGDDSTFARLDLARVREKTGNTLKAVDNLVDVAFSELDETSWEPLAVN